MIFVGLIVALGLLGGDDPSRRPPRTTPPADARRPRAQPPTRRRPRRRAARAAADHRDGRGQRLPEGRRPHARRLRDAARRRAHGHLPLAPPAPDARQRRRAADRQRPLARGRAVGRTRSASRSRRAAAAAAVGGQAPRLQPVSVRAGIVVTGTEVLTGRVSDRNGPWLSDQLLELGADTAAIVVVGDRPEEILRALRFLAGEGCALIVTSGGLGPTADDLTAEVVGRFQGREMVLDEALEGRIAEILRPLMARWPDLDPEAVLLSNRKQAVIPSGAVDPRAGRDGAGPRRDARLPGRRRRWSCCRARRASCSRCGRRRWTSPRCRRRWRARSRTGARCCGCSGCPESEIAATLRAAVDRGHRARPARGHDVPAARRGRGRHAL